MSEVSLTIRRTIRAGAARIFAAWIEPEQLMAWWGPPGVTCPEAAIDPRPGGRYRIVNAMGDGSRVVIEGVFERVEHDRLLVFT